MRFLYECEHISNVYRQKTRSFPLVVLSLIYFLEFLVSDVFQLLRVQVIFVSVLPQIVAVLESIKN